MAFLEPNTPCGICQLKVSALSDYGLFFASSFRFSTESLLTQYLQVTTPFYQ